MRSACSRRRSPMPRRCVPEVADDVVAVDEAMRLGYNWKYGPFELIDKLGTAWLVERLDRRRAWRCRRCCGDAAGKTFYRDRGRQAAAVSRRRRRLPRRRAPRRRAAAGGHQARRPADAEERLAPRCGTSATASPASSSPSKMQFARRRRSWRCSARRSRWCRQKFKALVIYNEGENFSVGANHRARPVRRQHRRLGRDREDASPAVSRPIRR